MGHTYNTQYYCMGYTDTERAFVVFSENPTFLFANPIVKEKFANILGMVASPRSGDRWALSISLTF